mmetsp:Transcript_32993/g.24291  ORF Transcript_32993/g.24291 Transcript_32993/m.24291 type:complete len:96 (+) Transcript_32993:559-846(+)
MFKLSGNSNLRIGYNSMGADCISNNLHFHLVYADELFGSGCQFPIENYEKKLFFKSNLKHLAEGEVDMYNCGIRFGEVKNWPLRTLLLSPDIGQD